MPYPVSHVFHIFPERLHLSSVPNNWDVSSWLCLYSSFFISFFLSCIHLFLKIRFSHFLLSDSVQFQLLHLLLRILQSRKQGTHWDSEVSETNTCPACLCSSWMVEVLMLSLKVHALPPGVTPSPAPAGSSSSLRF